MHKPVLVVMAAGMGSRYGGLKQLDPVGSHQQLIIDYSLYDAHRAGFDTVVFVIKRENEGAFRASIGDRLAHHMDVRYAFQELSDLPEGFSVPQGREKPWGTCHAVLAARREVEGPFAVINADDYYGAESFRRIYQYLADHPDRPGCYEFAMVGYRLGNTVTEHGQVSRGVCEEDADGFLVRVTERTNIEKDGGKRPLHGGRRPHLAESAGRGDRLDEPVGFHAQLPHGGGSALPGLPAPGGGGKSAQGRVLPAQRGDAAPRGG